MFCISCIKISGCMHCQYCKEKCQKAGKQRNEAQKLYCKGCKKYQQAIYQYKACDHQISTVVARLVCESVGKRGIARILTIAVGTVLKRVKTKGDSLTPPPIIKDQPTFEVDELWTYIGRKDNECWIAYGLDRQTRKVVDFVIGKRNKATLKILIDRLLARKPRQIRTDKLTIYQWLIPKELHRFGNYCINRIERKNLSLRTHLKRLSRRTICFSRSEKMLESCLRIYFWG